MTDAFSPFHFADRLTDAIERKRTPLIVGIDPVASRLPKVLRATLHDSSNHQAIADAFSQFGKSIIDAVHDLVPAVKPQAAFFEQLGPAGTAALAEVVDYAKQSGLLVIMDAKRGDIGSTATAYAAAYLGPKSVAAWGCDCLTVNPYMGFDTLDPFDDAAQKNGAGLFVLCRTSNPGSASLQEKVDRESGDSIRNLVADEIERRSAASAGQCGYGVVGAVVGATWPQQLAELRERMPHTIFLVPGFGAQGGSAADVAPAFDKTGHGAVVNSSRGIIFAFEQPKYELLAETSWTDAVRQAATDAIDQIAEHTPAGNLR